MARSGSSATPSNTEPCPQGAGAIVKASGANQRPLLFQIFFDLGGRAVLLDRLVGILGRRLGRVAFGPEDGFAVIDEVGDKLALLVFADFELVGHYTAPHQVSRSSVIPPSSRVKPTYCFTRCMLRYHISARKVPMTKGRATRVMTAIVDTMTGNSTATG